MEDRSPSVRIHELSFIPRTQWRKICSRFLNLEFLKYFPIEALFYLVDRYLYSPNAKLLPVNHGLWELGVSKLHHELNGHVQANTRTPQPQLILIKKHAESV